MPVLLKKCSSSTARLRVQIPASLLAEIEVIRREADGRGLVFDVSSVCADALARAVKQARTELRSAAGPSAGQGED